MSNNYNQHNGQTGFDASWIPVFAMLLFIPPIGLIMLFNKIKKSSTPEQKVRKPLSGMSIAMIAFGLMLVFNGEVSAFGWLALLGGAAAFFFSRRMKADERMYLKYANVIGTRPVVPVKAIAAAMPVPYDKAVRDLQKMIDDGYFGVRAYIDHSTNMFVVDSRISQNFINKTAREYGEPVQAGQAAPAPSPAPVKIDPRTEIEREFQQKLDEMRKLNDAIKDEDISAKVYRIEEVTGSIFELVREKPQKRSEIHTFMNYYLPTTIKLLSSYSVLERQNVLGQNIVTSKENIEKMVDQLVFAFEQQLDMMFEAEARDINTDITVLERMMQRDGLSENPYQMPKIPQAPKAPSPFETPSDFVAGAALAQQEEEQ